MSLDVYLHGARNIERDTVERIFIRENGSTREISRAEWDTLYPDREPVTFFDGGESDVVYSANITHNLNTMAMEAGIYEYLWRPDEFDIKTASELIEPLEIGLERLQSTPVYFKRFDPENGWGTYEGLCQFVRNYLAACKQYPDATVEVSR